MRYFNKSKKEIFFWMSVSVVVILLKSTGLQAEVIANVQHLFLLTGISQPKLPTAQPVAVNSLENTTVYENNKTSLFYEYDFALTTLEGKKMNLKELQGKVVFLNVWATWCPPCLAEMPGIFKLYQKTDTTKVAFVMLSVDENPEKVKKYMARKNYTFPVYLPAGKFPSDLASKSIPNTFILDTRGKIVDRHEGMANYDNDEFRKYLLNLYEEAN